MFLRAFPIRGHYIDEFAEAHRKDLVVRGALGAAVPSAGVACAIDRDVLGRLAGADDTPFDPTSMTEDYELGMRIAALGRRGALVRVRGGGSGSGGAVATREHFPATFDTAVRQKTRWLLGIALDGWDRVGWRSGLANRYMLLRDRKTIVAPLLVGAGYVAVAMCGIDAVVAWALPAARRFPAIAPRGSLLAALLVANAAALGWRLGLRAGFTGATHGWREGLRAVPRTVVANGINAVAAVRALRRYARIRGGREAPHWDKTAHRFPAGGGVALRMTTSRPARALRDGVLLLACAVVYRLPAVERAFVAALAAAEDRVRRPETAARSRDGVALAAAPGAVRALSPATLAVSRLAAPSGSGEVVAVASSALSPASAALPHSALPLTVALAVAAPSAGASPSDTRPADALATAAYARLAAGDRRAAVRLFDAALAGDDPRNPGWRRQRDALTRHWSGSAYSIVRAGGDPALAVTPVLGGGQSGAAIAFTPDPLSPRPFAVTARGSIAHADAGRSAFVAVGVQWHPFAGVTLAAERLIAVGPAAPNDWTVRAAVGTDRTFGRWRATAYGEGGLIGHATYAAIQGRAAAVFHLAHIEIDPGAGVWSSLQHDRGTLVDRVDVGPGVVARAGPFAAEVDYRFRVAGNAAPGSGPVLTLSAAF